MTQKNSFIRKEEANKKTINVPDDWIPVEEAGLNPPKKDVDTFNIRMNNDDFLYNLFHGLAGLTKREHEGRYYLAPIKNYTPYLSYEGALEIVNDLRLLNNPSVVLGFITEEEMKTQFRHIHEALTIRFAVEKDFFQVTDSARYSLMAFLETVVFNQLSRAINGRENKMLQTQIIEQRQDQSITETIGRKKSGIFA